MEPRPPMSTDPTSAACGPGKVSAVTDEQLRRIADQLASYSDYICPSCLPELSVHITVDRWRLTVDHSFGCEEYARRVVGRALDDDLMAPEFDQIVRALELDTAPDPAPDVPGEPPEGSPS
jgi:hypothetical protein